MFHSLPAPPTPQTLCLDYHPFARNYIHSFDARAVVAKLTQLETLALIGWGGFDLDSLPRSLRTLVVRGFGFPVCEMEGPVLSSASEFNIPEECRCACTLPPPLQRPASGTCMLRRLVCCWSPRWLLPLCVPSRQCWCASQHSVWAAIASRLAACPNPACTPAALSSWR